MASNRKSRRIGWADNEIAPLLEGGLLLVIGVVGLAIRQPLIFASLGPTAYEMVEKPESPSSRPYHIFAGHMIGLAAGFAAVAMLHAWSEPKVLSSGAMTATRVWVCVVGAALTVFFTLLCKAGQPAALATNLLVCLGSFETLHDAFLVAGAVALLIVLGEPIRRLRVRAKLSPPRPEIPDQRAVAD